MTKNKLFDRISLQAKLREIINTWGEHEGYEIIHTALQKEIHYEHDKKSQTYSNNSHNVLDNRVCRTQPLE